MQHSSDIEDFRTCLDHSLFGVEIKVEAPKLHLARVAACFRNFGPAVSARDMIHIGFHVVLDPPDVTHFSTNPNRIFTDGKLSYWDKGNIFLIKLATEATIVVDISDFSMECYLTFETLRHVALVEMLVIAALQPLLRRYERYMFHASAVAKNGQAIVLAGNSGSGKTTAGLGLVRSGWKFIANDRTVLRNGCKNVGVYGFLETIKIHANTASFYPELQNTLPELPIPDEWSFDIVKVYGNVFTVQSDLKAIVFPRVSPGDQTRITKVDKGGYALDKLVESSADAWDKRHLGAHFEFLLSLVRRFPTYEMVLGGQLHELPKLVDAIFSERIA